MCRNFVWGPPDPATNLVPPNVDIMATALKKERIGAQSEPQFFLFFYRQATKLTG